MLVFTRRRDEAIVIGDRIEIKVLRIGKDGVSIGVTAPADVPVHRREIYELIRAANAGAAASPDRLRTLAAQLAAAPATGGRSGKD